jgi:3-oxoacyl-[acyl-carrier protein] reductase
MDLGLQGKRAIVCASSKGLGFACARALAREGAHIVMNGRDPESLAKVADVIRSEVRGIDIQTVAGDVTDASVRAALVNASGEPDILVNNAGGPPPGDFRDWNRDTWIAALDANLMSAVDLIRLVIDGMTQRKFGRIVNITSSTVRVPIPVLGLSNAARAGLTNFVFGLAPSVSSSGITINNLLPGPFDTNRLRHSKEITRHLTSNPVAGRVGDPDELGAACAFLCSRQAGYITGQNLLMDGGLYPGSF